MKIVVLGFGRMGSWIAGELSGSHEVFVYDRDPAKTRNATGILVLERVEDIAGLKPDLLINAVDLAGTVEAYRAVEKMLPPDCFICDLASIKTSLPDYYRACPLRFGSCHPMFGPTFADPASLGEESAVVIRESYPEAAAFLENFFRGKGITVRSSTFDEHDRLMAYALTMPFVASMVFAACLDRPSVPGTTFKRHRTIAEKLLGEDDGLLAEILFNPHSLPQLEKITQKLEFLKHIIGARDGEEARRLFARLRENIART
ncbi:MAG: prephenate dehydrogenase/arogenate dehydrogenase family protein [Candidatus Aminicenantales bacterium]